METRTQIHLGASMYSPTTLDKAKLVAIANGTKYPNLRSVIFCTEDAVRSDEMDRALHNLRRALAKMEVQGAGTPMRFIRVRNPEVLGQCLSMKGIEKIDGFVLPKVTINRLPYYLGMFSDRDEFKIMPTLETKEVFNAKEMGILRKMLTEDESARKRTLCLRIGGNDLLNCLKVRRDPRRTIYATPVGDVIRQLAGEFIPHGFGLSAPVCESLLYPEVLREECELDLLQGLFGKTAINPTQIDLIEDAFKVAPNDLEEAQAILKPDAKAVFNMNNRMCEPATHRAWARDITKRAEIYGVTGGGIEPVRPAA